MQNAKIKKLAKLSKIFIIFALFSCHQLEEEYSFNLYYQHKITHFNTIDEHSDIPLAIGLKIINNDDEVNFHSKNGNVISISFVCEKDLLKVKSFYTHTLPQLGWEISSNEEFNDFSIVSFVRDGETLEIEFVDDGSAKIVNFHAQLHA